MPRAETLTLNELLDPHKAKQYFARNHQKLVAKLPLPRIQRVQIFVVRRTPQNPRKAAQSFIAFYDLHADRRQTVRIVGLVSADGSRAAEYRALVALAEHARQHPKLCVPEPLFYDAALGAAFTVYVEGTSLYETLNQARNFPKPVLRSVLAWIETFQSLPQDTVPVLYRKPPFQFLQQNLRRVERMHPAHAQKLARAWRQWKERFRSYWKEAPRVLAQGDFNPGNIQVPLNANRVCVVDFGNLTLAPRFWDLAGLLSQIQTLNGRYLTPSEIRRIQRTVLATWNREVSTLSASDREEITWLKRFYDITAAAHLLAWETDHEAQPIIKQLLRTL